MIGLTILNDSGRESLVLRRKRKGSRLTQPVQILITWKNFADVAFPIFTSGDNGILGTLPTAFSSVNAQFRQTSLVNSEHLLSRVHDMNSKMLVYPLRSFAQTAFRTQVTGVNSGATFSLNATGLRSGSIKHIDVYFTTPTVAGAGNNWNFLPVKSLQMLVNGLIWYDSDNSNSALWNLCDSAVPLQVATTSYVVTTATPNTVAASVGSMPFYRIQLGQRAQPLAYESEMSLGLNIANSVVNINAAVLLPTGVSDVTVTATLVYHYSCNLIATKGTMEYLFT